MTREQKRLVFIQAHRLARKHNGPGDCYAVTFAAALRLILAQSRRETIPAARASATSSARKAAQSVVRFVAVLFSIFLLLAIVGLFAAAGIIGEGTAVVVSLALSLATIWACCPTKHSKRTGP